MLTIIVQGIPNGRPEPNKRRFTSPVIEQVIQNISSRMKDKDLASIFSNCLPNTLDTTVYWNPSQNDTFVITGLQKIDSFDSLTQNSIRKLVIFQHFGFAIPQIKVIKKNFVIFELTTQQITVWPYLSYINQDDNLKKMIVGLINRQGFPFEM